jgi:hypothetical protein
MVDKATVHTIETLMTEISSAIEQLVRLSEATDYHVHKHDKFISLLIFPQRSFTVRGLATINDCLNPAVEMEISCWRRQTGYLQFIFAWSV